MPAPLLKVQHLGGCLVTRSPYAVRIFIVVEKFLGVNGGRVKKKGRGEIPPTFFAFCLI